MAIETWVERIIKIYKTDKHKDINKIIDYGQQLHNTLPLKTIIQQDYKKFLQDNQNRYDQLLQEHHDKVYNAIIKKYEL